MTGATIAFDGFREVSRPAEREGGGAPGAETVKGTLIHRPWRCRVAEDGLPCTPCQGAELPPQSPPHLPAQPTAPEAVRPLRARGGRPAHRPDGRGCEATCPRRRGPAPAAQARPPSTKQGQPRTPAERARPSLHSPLPFVFRPVPSSVIGPPGLPASSRHRCPWSSAFGQPDQDRPLRLAGP